MRVTPLDIRKQEFKKVMRGLDSEEVFAFLNTIAEEYEAVLSDNKNLRERLVALEERLNEYKAIETNLRNTLLTAEKLTAEAKENARREASLLIREAEMEADRAAESIRAHTSQLRREILELKKNKDNYITRLKTLLDGHRKMIDGFEEDFAGVDQAIEKIGKQVEEDVRKPVAPPRMNRDKITENFGHEAKDKVTWGEERRREDEPRPQMPRPGFETREAPNQKTKRPEDTLNMFTSPFAGEAAAGMGQGPDQAPAVKTAQAPIRQQPEAPGAQAAPGDQDDWRQYEVRKQPTDWKSYEIQGQRPQQPPQVSRHPSAVPPEQRDHEVDSALSSLREVAEAREEIPRVDMNRMPGQKQAPAQAAPQTPPQAQAPPQQAPQAQPVSADTNTESTWSMEDLRRNLTNLTKDEGNKK